MDIVSQVLHSILELPWIVKGPGIALMGFLLLRAVFQLFTLRLIKSLTNVAYTVIIALLLHHYGQDIVAYLASVQPAPSS